MLSADKRQPSSGSGSTRSARATPESLPHVPHPGGREAAVLALMRELNTLAAQRGATFFLAKDSPLTPEQFAQATPTNALRHFQALTAACDPDELLQTDLYRRVLRPALAMV